MTNAVWNYLWDNASDEEIREAIIQTEGRIRLHEEEYGTQQIRNSGVYFQFYADLKTLYLIVGERSENRR